MQKKEKKIPFNSEKILKNLGESYIFRFKKEDFNIIYKIATDLIKSTWKTCQPKLLPCEDLEIREAVYGPAANGVGEVELFTLRDTYVNTAFPEEAKK